MKYYRIFQIDNLPNIIKPILPSHTDLWSDSNPFFIPGVAKKPLDELDFLPFYQSHCFLIADPIKKIWRNYQIGGRYRSCAMGSIEQGKVKIYAAMVPYLIDGAHKETIYKKNGEVETLILDQKAVGFHKVFGIKSWHRINVFMTEDILEEVLQENITSFGWEMVEALP